MNPPPLAPRSAATPARVLACLLALALFASFFARPGAAAELDFRAYFEEDRVAKAVLGTLNLFTLDEAKRCIAILDQELAREPGNDFYGGMKSVILSVFRASFAAEGALSALEVQTREIERLESLARDSMKPSALTGRPDEITATRYRRDAEQRRRNADEAIAKARADLQSALGDALAFASFARDRGRGRIGAKIQQIAKLKSQPLDPSSAPLPFWSEEDAAQAMAVEDAVHDALARGSKALVERRYFEIDRVASEALRTAPGNVWLQGLKRESDDAVKRSGEMLAEAVTGRDSKQYEAALAFAEKSLDIAADNEPAQRLKGELDGIIREKSDMLAKASTLESGGALAEALEIFERYAMAEDVRRVAGGLGAEREGAGDFIGANRHYKTAGDSEGILRTQQLMEEQTEAYSEAETLLAENRFEEARAIYGKYSDTASARQVDVMEGRRESALGNYDRALELFRGARSAQDVESLNRFLEERTRNLAAGSTAEQSGNLQASLLHFEAADDREGVARVALRLAKKMEEEGLLGSAIDYYDKAGDTAAAAALRERTPSGQLAYRSLTPQQIFEECNPACLTVENLENGGLGSGFFVARGGYVLTNWHVIGSARIVNLRLADGRRASARVLDSSEVPDLALLKTDLEQHPVLKLGDSGLVRTGEAVSVIGTPIVVELSSTFANGHIAAVGREFQKNKVFQIDVTINHGNSGGPLLNERGQVVGINTFGLGDFGAQGLNFSIEINEALPMLRSNRVPGY